MTRPIVYEVDRIRDGRTFTARRVQAIQGGQPILSMMTSFQREEPGLEHQTPMPQVPPPEQLKSLTACYEQWLDEVHDISERMHTALTREVAIEVTQVKQYKEPKPKAAPPEKANRFRAAEQMTDD